LAFQAMRWVVSVSEDIEKVSEPTMLSCPPPPFTNVRQSAT
jgi:hypothetical protein